MTRLQENIATYKQIDRLGKATVVSAANPIVYKGISSDISFHLFKAVIVIPE